MQMNIEKENNTPGTRVGPGFRDRKKPEVGQKKEREKERKSVLTMVNGHDKCLDQFPFY